MTSVIEVSRPEKHLIEGRMMTCPRCKKQHDVLAYNVLEVIEEYAKETTPIYKCPACKWMFAPAEPLAAKLLADLLEEIAKLNAREVVLA